MAEKRDYLLKLLKFVKEICDEPGNEWFRGELFNLFNPRIKLCKMTNI